MKSHRLSIFPIFKKYGLPLRKSILLMIVLSLIQVIFTTSQPLVLSGFVELINGNIITGNINETASSNFFNLNYLGSKFNNFIFTLMEDSKSDQFFEIAVFIVIIFIFLSFFVSLFGYLSQIVSSKIQIDSARLIRADLSRHILGRDMEFFNTRNSGELISRYNQDAINIAKGVGPLIYAFFHHGFLIIIYSIYLFATDKNLTFALIFIGLTHWIVTKFLKNPVRTTSRNYFDKLAKLNHSLQEGLLNIRAIKIFKMEGIFQKEINMHLNGANFAEYKASKLRKLEPNLRLIVDSFAISAILLIGVVKLDNGSISVTGLLLFLLVGRLIIAPINKFSVNFLWIQAMLASYEKIHEIFLQKNSVSEGKQSIYEFKESIKVENLSFVYDEKEILKDISFVIDKGDLVAIVGPSGSGKSTLVDIILRLYDPNDGKIFIDGKDIKDFKIDNYRKLFGVVSQENYLLNDSIKNNICFGDINCNIEKVKYAAKIANADRFIDFLPDKYDTKIGERGVVLSGGQRQRLSIARSVYTDPKVFILDEATSSLDSDSEKIIYSNLKKISKNRTSIIIAHRLSTIVNANKIIVLNDGKMEGFGTHESLYQKSNFYRKMCDSFFDKGV